MKLYPPSRAAWTLSIGLVLLVATTIFAQQLSAPNSADEQTARLVAEMISKYHISQRTLDDEVSAKLLKRYLEELDPQKLYFLQSDIDEFRRYRNHLDDLLKVGKVDFAYETYDRFLTRLNERIEMAQSLIDADYDYSVDESVVIDGEELDWARDKAELDERWRKRIKYDLLTLKIDPPAEVGEDAGEEQTPAAALEAARERLHKRYHRLQKTARETEDGEVLEMYLSAVAHCFDPHSSYMSPQTLEDFQIQMRLSLEGIGAALRSEDGYTVVAQIVKGGAADKDGRLQVNDKIIAVAQEDGEFVDIIEMKLTRVVRLIRGPKGSKVRLRVIDEQNQTHVYELTRQKIELTSSEVKGDIIQAGDWFPGSRGRIGVINIPSFYRDFGGAQQGVENFKSTARDVLKVLEYFRSHGGVDAIVVDLRLNGGGALSEAIEVSGLFLDQGPIVQVKEQDGRIRTHDDVDAGQAYSGPLIVICNRLSASASEIFAAAIKDYNRGIVIGDTTTHGKGTVQNVMPVSNRLFQLINPQNRGALKLTIQQFYRVNGASTQNRGVQSDIVLPSLIDHMDLGESFLDNALAFDQIDPAEHSDDDLVTADLIATLRNKSQQRVQTNDDFQKSLRDIERYLERKNRKEITLNEADLRKEREAEQAERDELEELTDNGDSDDGEDPPVFPDTYYNKEVLQIALDYVSLLRSAKTAQN